MKLQKLVQKTLGTLLLSMLCLTAFAQGRSIQGTVVDSSGEPVIGANVLVVGTTNGVITDIDGNFRLSDVPSNAKLQVSFIGFITQTIEVGNQTEFNVTLKDDSQALEEVVVIGYGTVRRRDLTGAVASVTGEKLAANPVANVAQALQGQLPGVSVTSQDGRPGASMSIRVRGGGSITQSNDPLFIVDGVQVSTIDDIPADNIESIDVLKDAASTAIYGARGANGVILVTTKGGKEGKVSVKYNMYYQVKENPETLDVLDPYDYVLWNWSYATAYGDSYGENVAKYFGLGSANGNHLNDYKKMSTHNYIDDLMQTAGTWNHDVSLSGGNEKTTYYASVNYMNDEGIRINSGFRRWGANFKLNQKINKKLSFDLDLRYAETRIEGTKFEYATSAYSFRPVDNPLGEDEASLMGQGSTSVEQSLNPLVLCDNYERYRDVYRVRAKGGITWNIIKGLTAKSELSLSRNWNRTQDWNAGNNPTDQAFNMATLTKGDGYGVRWATTLNYEVQGLGEDHNLSFLVGNEVLSSKSNSLTVRGAGYPSDYTMDQAFGLINMSDPSKGKDYVENTIGTPTHTNSWFARGNYSFLGRYLLTATFRADGSSKFAPNHHWGYFPAAAIAWRLSDEPFMQKYSDWMDNLKVRFSYGTSGADNIDPSLWKETWVTEQVTIDGQSYTSYVPGDVLENPDLKWETTISRNFGIDFGFLNSRIRGSIDLYWNTTKNILMKVPCDASSGYSYQFQNAGKTSNKGVELALGADLVRSKNFNLSINATYNYNKNNVDEINANVTADTHTGWGSTMRKPYYDYAIREGEPVGLVMGYKSLGYYTVDDFTYANGVYTLKSGVPDYQGSVVNYPAGVQSMIPEGQTAFPGAAKFEDTNNNGVIDDDDLTVIGRMMPHHTGGFTFNGNYKSLDFSVGFTYQLDGNVYNANAMHSMMGNKDNQLGENRLTYVKDCWKMYDVNSSGDLYLVTEPTELSALNRNAKYAVAYSEYGITSSEFIESAAYLRLNTLTVGYTLPKNLTKKVGIENLRVYFTGSNLFHISGYSGLDPDVNTNANAGGDGFPTPYYDYNSYPKARTYTFGLNVAF